MPGPGVDWSEFMQMNARPQGLFQGTLAAGGRGGMGRPGPGGAPTGDGAFDLNSFLSGGLPAELEQLIMQRARGNVQPFGPNVQAGMLSQNADGAASGFAGDQDAIRQQMANSGLSGSGAELSAILSARSRADANVRTGRRDIRTRAEMENYGALERAQEQAAQYLQTRAGMQQNASQFQQGQEQQASQFDRSLAQQQKQSGPPQNVVYQGGPMRQPEPIMGPDADVYDAEAFEAEYQAREQAQAQRNFGRQGQTMNDGGRPRAPGQGAAPQQAGPPDPRPQANAAQTWLQGIDKQRARYGAGGLF